jgi:hypothetical protein
MANFATAVLTKYQAKITQMLQAGELRFRTPAIFNSIKASTEVMIPSHNQIKNAAKRITGEVNYIKRSKRALGLAGEIYNHEGSKGDSGVLVPAWQPYDDKFYYSLKQANASVYELDEMVLAELNNSFGNFADGLEVASATFLHTNRSGVNVYASQGYFNTDNDVFEIEQDFTSIIAAGYRAVQISKSVMGANAWSGALTFYCDSISYDKFETLAAQGKTNANDYSFQFSGITFIKAYDLDAKGLALGYTNGYWIVAPFGTLATMDWLPIQNRQGLVTQVNKYGTLIDPNTGLALATHEYQARADEQNNGGDKQDVKTQVQLFTYLSFNHTPLSVADETPLQAFGYVPAELA